MTLIATWSKTLPTEPGWYWIDYPEQDSTDAVHVMLNDFGRLSVTQWSWGGLSDMELAEWMVDGDGEGGLWGPRIDPPTPSPRPVRKPCVEPEKTPEDIAFAEYIKGAEARLMGPDGNEVDYLGYKRVGLSIRHDGAAQAVFPTLTSGQCPRVKEGVIRFADGTETVAWLSSEKGGVVISPWVAMALTLQRKP